MATITPTAQQAYGRLIRRAVANGQRRAEAIARLDEGLESHDGWNLVTFLTYNNYATETHAIHYVETYHTF